MVKEKIFRYIGVILLLEVVPLESDSSEALPHFLAVTRMNERSSRSTEPTWSSRWTGATLVLLLLLVLCTVPLLLLQFASGSVSGQEFAPESFKRRDFRYMEIPWVHVQISGITRSSATGELATYLSRKKYIRSPKAPTTRWDLVYDTTADRSSAACDASILCKYLDSRDAESELIWLKWSRNEPKLAEVFWPAVAELAVQGRYVFVPPLFQLAMHGSDPQDLKRQIDLSLADQFTILGHSEQEMNNHQEALEHFETALAHVPDFSAALQGRTVSRQAQEQLIVVESTDGIE